MRFSILKKARVFISLIFFFLITFLFIDFTNSFSAKLIQGILYLQLIPSLVNFIKFTGLAAGGFVLIIVLTLIFGRVYCSTICPLGILQDIIIWFNGKIRRKKTFRKQKAFNVLRYTILIISVFILLIGLFTPLLFLDPYSNYGRIVVNLFRPIYLLLNNIGAHILESIDIYTLYRVEPGVTHWFSIAFSMAVFMLILWLSIKYARLFCNTICPVGAFLGFLSKYSLFQISLDQSLCTSCGNCSNACKAGCIDIDKKIVDFSRCVACYNCLTSCPSNGVKYNFTKKTKVLKLRPFDPSRRNFLVGTVITVTSLAPLALFAYPQKQRGGGRGRGGRTPRPVVKKHPVSPPGSISHEHFNDACTACHLCVSACPTHVIKPSLFEYGLAGIMQPRLDYHAGFCNFDCVVCSEICPTGALQPLGLEEKHVLQLGKVKFIKQNCIVVTEGTDCGACSEHCPTKAVDMRPFRGKLLLPVVNPDICVGCGACEYACPTKPKSIYVEGNPVHEIAKKPLIEKLEQPEADEDFPF